MFKFSLRYTHKICTSRKLLHWFISSRHPISSTSARDRTENTCKMCTVCLNISSFANVTYKRHKQVSRVATLMSPDVKVLAEFSMQLPDSSKRQLAVCRLFAKYWEKQMENVHNIHKSSRSQSQWLDTSSCTVWSRCPSLSDKNINTLHSWFLWAVELFGLSIHSKWKQHKKHTYMEFPMEWFRKGC